ncbi:MAG: hypothetical protein J6334_12385 [Kiritimatiellae bacterium]|nr:hypothetical protein [Kiritimatiellia bacterium]
MKVRSTLFLLIPLLFAGCETTRVADPEPADPEFADLLRRGATAAAQGAYGNASRFYGRAMDRAMVIDRPREIAIAALCRCPFALNDGDAADAERCLSVIRTLDLDEDFQLRIADFELRKRWLAGEPEEPALRNLEEAVAKMTAPPSITCDARLTLLEAKLRSGKRVDRAEIPTLEDVKDPPGGLVNRQLALRAWATRDADTWLEAIRRYARAGNIPAALREAKRCSEVLNSEAAARLGKQIAEGAHVKEP